MELARELAILADAAKYDASCASSGTTRRTACSSGGLGSTTGTGICHSYTPDGRCISLLKILLTNCCIYDCLYCINRISSNVQRARFTPEEIVRLTLDFYRRNYIEGLFLSSGIIRNPDYTMEQVNRVARILRVEHKFREYIHLKTIPEASPALIEEARPLGGDRISINIELPTAASLRALAPEKNFANTQRVMVGIRDRIEEAKSDCRKNRKISSFAPAGQSTQMIVGATDASDAIILEQAASLYRNQRLRRVYYSAFSPIPDALNKLPLEAPPLVREHRLYQADWLVRFYGFAPSELITNVVPNLDLSVDPKLAWALRHRHFFPVDLNTAPRQALLPIPGLGTKNVECILQIRRWHKLRILDLLRLRVRMRKILPFVTTADKNPDTRRLEDGNLLAQLLVRPTQLDLFPPEVSVIDGQL